MSKSRRDGLERIIEESRGTLLPVKYHYNVDGKLSKISQGDRVINLYYDLKGYLSKIVDPLGRVQSSVKDSMGRTLQSSTFDNRKTKFNYDLNGRLTKLTTPTGKEHNFTYNEHELLASYNPPPLSIGPVPTTYQYNLDKQLTKIIKADSKEIDYEYRPGETRIYRIGTQEGQFFYGYGGLNIPNQFISSITKHNSDHNSRLSYTYNVDKISSETLGPAEEGGTYWHKIHFDYDDRFRLSRIYLKDGTEAANYPVTYSYDRDNYLTKAGELLITRNQLGYQDQLQLYKAKVKYTYDQNYGELSGINFTFNNVSKFVREFKRDRLGRIVEENDGSGPQTIFYDQSGRLTGRAYKNANIILSSYTYDKNGNRIRGFEGDKKFTAQYDDHDRLIKFNDTSYEYNPNGDLQSKTTNGQTTFYAYDTLGNLTAVYMPGKNVQYHIDPKHRRSVKMVDGNFVSRYVWQDQLRIVAELDQNNNVKSRFVYAEGINSPEYMVKNGRKYLFVKDHRGSINMVVDSETGGIIQKIRYSDMGEVLEDSNPGFQPFGFAGGLYDPDTKLVRFGARDYDPEVGRWITKDPIRFNGGDTNLYRYVLSDPINLKDTRGLEFDEEDVKEALKNAYDAAKEAIKEGKENVEDNLERIKDWGDRIIEDAEESIKKFTEPEKDNGEGANGKCDQKITLKRSTSKFIYIVPGMWN